jgi:hypothetical protein
MKLNSLRCWRPQKRDGVSRPSMYVAPRTAVGTALSDGLGPKALSDGLALVPYLAL